MINRCETGDCREVMRRMIAEGTAQTALALGPRDVSP